MIANVPPDHLYALLTAALRYALGRSSYVVRETCDLVLAYYPYLSIDQRITLMNYLSREVADLHLPRSALYRTIAVDAHSWKELSEWMFQHNVMALPIPADSAVCPHNQTTDTLPSRCHACGEIVR